MSRSVFLLAASALALSACQPASETSETGLEAETPPPVTDTAEAPDIVEVAADPEDHTDEEHGDDHDADHDAEHGDGDHDDHDAEGHDDHDHDEHDDADDHAGGEAHVHGVSDLAASLDGTTLSINIEGALANFDVDESRRELDDSSLYTDSTVAVLGGNCARDSASASIRPIGDHGNLMIDLSYTCASPDAIEAIDVIGFDSFDGFEEVHAVYLTDTGQTAETLTASDTRLDID